MEDYIRGGLAFQKRLQFHPVPRKEARYLLCWMAINSQKTWFLKRKTRTFYFFKMVNNFSRKLNTDLRNYLDKLIPEIIPLALQEN